MSGQQPAPAAPSKRGSSSSDKWLASDDAGEQMGQLPADAWRKVHPLTPVLQAAGLVFGLVMFFLYLGFAQVAAGVATFLESTELLVIIVVIGLALLLIIGGSGLLMWLAWTRTRFAVDHNAVYLQKGVIAKQQRVARLNRVQAVDIVEPLVARIFGLARVDVEVAGGLDSKIQIAYLKVEAARQLRADIQGKVRAAKTSESAAVAVDSASGAASGTVAPGMADEHAELEYPLLQVPVKRLIAASLVSPSTLAVVVSLLIGFGITTVGFILEGAAGGLTGGFFLLTIVLPFALATFGVIFAQINAGFNFRLSVGHDGIRIRRGLTETRSQTIAPTRIQAIQLRQGIVWRMLGWWKVQINVAGYGMVAEGSEAGAQTLMLPVGDRDQALTTLWTVLPDLGSHDVLATLDAALEGDGNAAGFLTSPRQARWFDPISWRHNGVLLTQTATIIRRHRFSRTVTFIPHARVQSVSLEQGPLERNLGLIDFASHSVSGPVTNLRAIHLAEAQGAAIMAMQAERIVAEQHRESIEQWQRRMGLPSS